MEYEQAATIYTKHASAQQIAALQPNRKLSEAKGGRWIMRNTNGFLAYVTSSGKVLNSRFQEINPAN